MKALGQPFHPVIAIFPMSLLAASVALDLAVLVGHRIAFAPAARWALGAGAVAGTVVAIPGILDALAYPQGARMVPARHGILNGTVVLLMALDWWLRGRAEVPAPPAALAISGLAAAIAVIAWRQGTRLTPAPTPPRIQPARES